MVRNMETRAVAKYPTCLFIRLQVSPRVLYQQDFRISALLELLLQQIRDQAALLGDRSCWIRRRPPSRLSPSDPLPQQVELGPYRDQEAAWLQGALKLWNSL